MLSSACVITQKVCYGLRRAVPDIKGSEINKKGHTWKNHMHILIQPPERDNTVQKSSTVQKSRLANHSRKMMTLNTEIT